MGLLGIACADEPTDGDLRTDEIGAADLFDDGVSVICDGEASLFDWLVVFRADTVVEVVDVDAEVIQGGFVFGPVSLDEVRTGEWYAEVWEDDLGMDCEGSPIGATFYAIADDGTEQTLDL